MSFNKILKQVERKPLKLAKVMKFSKAKTRKFGKSSVVCRKCGRTEGVIRKYGLNYCRQCFREEANKLGFNKYS